MKKFILGLFVGVAITASSSVFADDIISKVDAYINPSIPITLNEKHVALDNPPAIIDGSTYLKLRDVAKLTDLQVNWNDRTKTIELKSVIDPEKAVPSKDVTTQIQQPLSTTQPSQTNEDVKKVSMPFFANGIQVQPEMVAQIQGTYMVPIRLLAETLGLTATWNDANKTITLESGENKAVFTLNQRLVQWNKNTFQLEQPVTIIDGATLLPIRIAEIFQGRVEISADKIELSKN